MLHQIIPGKRLLDHQQFKNIQLPQSRRLSRIISAVRVHHQRRIRKLLPDSLNQLQVPTRLNLDLNPTITLLHKTTHHIHQLLPRPLQTNTHTTRHRTLGPTQQLAQRLSRALSKKVPERHLNRRLRHIIPTNRIQRRQNQTRILKLLPQQQRNQILLQDKPSTRQSLRTIPRTRANRTLAKTRKRAIVQSHNDARLLLLPPTTRLKRRNQWHLELAKLHRTNLHQLPHRPPRLQEIEHPPLPGARLHQDIRYHITPTKVVLEDSPETHGPSPRRRQTRISHLDNALRNLHQ